MKKLLLIAALASAGGLTVDYLATPAEAIAQPSRAARRQLKPSELVTSTSMATRPLVLVGALGALSLLPFVIIMVTSFVKISVVLSIVRSALGTQQTPPTQIITGLATILTVYIMTPVGLECYREAQSLIEEQRPGSSLVSAETVDLMFSAAGRAEGPIKDFLIKNSHLKDRATFCRSSAFVISELKEAFQIGFIIFVPFLVIDIVVANILMALGMQMLSPTTISLPFKLLLFVVIDGWYLITKGLIIGYI